MKKVAMKKILSVFLSVLLVILAIVPTFAPIVASAAKANDAYAVIFTASDFQSTNCYNYFTAMMQSAKADGITETPEAFLFGGDYTSGSEDPAVQVPKVIDTVQAMYAGYDESNMIFVQGNHDAASDVLTPTGFHEFENFLVYSINEDNFKNSQLGNNRGEAYYQEIQTLAQDIAAKFEEVKNSGDTRPIFVVTHLPLHHMSRDSYGDNLYGKPIFDVLNEYGQSLDIIFLFGHNHSSNYDDYIGGAVNYLAKGEEIRIPIPDASQAGENGYTTEELNFTYMNAGYVGYSNNGTSDGSTDTLTMGAFELCNNTIEISRYSTDGLYTTETIERVNPNTTDPYVRVSGETAGTEGNSDIVYGSSGNIEGATYSWSTSNTSVVKVLPAGKNAQVIYTGEGTADVTLTVTGADGNTYSQTITIDVKGATRTETVPGESYSVYKLTNTIVPGKKYVIASRNTVGSSTAITATLSNNRYLAQTTVSVVDGSSDSNIGAPYIQNPGSGIIWTAGGSSGANTFMNGSNYMSTNGSNRFRLNTTATTWSYTNNRLKVSNANYYVSYGSSRYSLASSGTNVYFYEETTISTPDREEVVTDPYEPNVLFNKGSNDINGQTLKLYKVKFDEGFMIDGSFTGFSDKADNVTTTWSSSDPSVATVENGYVTYVGKGETTITYTVTDGTTTITKSVTLALSDKEKPLDYYNLTNTLVDGELYIIASTNALGTTEILTPPVIDTGKTDHRIRFSETSSTVQLINGVLGVSTTNETPVWRAISTGTSGYFYLYNDANGYYMYANNDAGTNDLGSTTDVNTNGTVWHVNSAGFLASNDSMAIKHSGDGNFRACPEAEAAGNYLYQKTEIKPSVNIRARYESVNNTTMIRENICPFQTETLLPKPQSFTVADENITYRWESSNPDVATIDDNGVVTYTGNPGTAEFTVYATATVPNEDGEYETGTAKTAVEVKPLTMGSADNYVLTTNFVDGEYYIISGSNAAGSAYILGNETNTTVSTSEYRINGVSTTITQGTDGATINNTDSGNVWQAEDAGNGYFRLKNVESGEYLALVADDNYSPYRRVTTAPLGEYDAAAYLIATNSSNQVYSQQSMAYSSNILRMQDGYFRLSATDNKGYIYQKVSSEALAPKTEIRVSTILGTDDISNHLQNRYNIKAGDTERVLRYAQGFESVTGTEWSVSDKSVATIDENGLITYTGKEGFVSVTLEVTGIDSTGEEVTQTVMTTFNVSNDDYEEPTNDYPQYPHEGSVRVNKTASNNAGGYNFQTSGVTEVELSITGVPLPQAVDVVVVFDHSSSMNNGTRLTNAIEDTRDFAMQVVHANENNRIAIVTFDRSRGLYNGLTATSITTESGSEDKIITGDGTPEGAFMTVDESEELLAQVDSLASNSVAGTNYDYGLQQAYQILKAAKSDPDANKMQYIVFMSDGEPFGFNRVDFGSATTSGYDGWHTGDETDATIADVLANSSQYPAAEYFNTRGENWYAEIIKTPEGGTLSDMPAVDYYDGYREGLGATIFTIGYDAGTPGTVTNTVLSTMASTPDNFYYAEGNLQTAYDSILEKIIYAANNAVVTDKMGENFALQFAPSLTLDNGMATITFDPAPHIEIGSWTLNSDGTRNKYTAHETITFETDANGNLTAAYSNLLGSKNIYDVSTNKIVGSKVTYDITNETFTWNVGDITRDEVTLKYYAYLEGSAEGEREAGTYYTNEYAYVDYINYRGNECHQVFPMPSIAWKDAVVNYEFYLVNEKGQPVNRDGIVVPFAERVLVGQERTKNLILNSSGEYSAIVLIAKEEVPAGYVLFNEDTSYSVAVSSGDNPSKATINDDAAIKTTYFRDGTILYSGHGDVPNVADYMNTHVSFAVLNVGGVAPDSVVIDYGLPVKISILANDINASSGKLTAIGTTLVEGTELNNIPYVESRLQDATNSITLENGTATIEGNQIVYTPSNLTMSTENVFYYEYLTDDGIYLYTTVTVIPAANIYYEESFFTFKDGDGYAWQTVGDTLDDKFQAEDRPGTFSFADIDANNVYGMDHAYDDSYTYSLGSAKYATIDAGSPGKEPTAEFTFSGTGFDLFSVTNSNTGAVLVSIYKPGQTKEYKNFIVQTYYGYSYEVDEEGNGKYVVTPDSEDCMYQVPVISARDLGYDTYRVVIKPLYVSWFDMTGDGSYDIYVDSVRIYDPAGETVTEDSVIGDAYLEDSEYNPHYTELRKTILAANTFYDDIYNLDSTQYSQGSIFIDSIASLDSNGISDKFLEAGPNNEVYLAKGQAIAFHLTSDTDLSPTSVELGMKTISGNSSEVALMNTNSLIPRYVTVSGAHEMYRRLASVIVWDEEVLTTTGKYQTKYPIVIVNTSDSILSLTHLKWAFSSAGGEGDVQVVVNSDTPAMAYAAARSVMAPFPYTDEDIQMKWSDTTLTEGKEVTLTITTPADIAQITIDGIVITDYTVDSSGNKVWTYTFTVTETGENTYDILLFANNGKVSQPMVTETITVTEEPTETNIFKQIIEWIKRVLAFFKEVIA